MDINKIIQLSMINKHIIWQLEPLSHPPCPGGQRERDKGTNQTRAT